VRNITQNLPTAISDHNSKIVIQIRLYLSMLQLKDGRTFEKTLYVLHAFCCEVIWRYLACLPGFSCLIL